MSRRASRLLGSLTGGELNALASAADSAKRGIAGTYQQGDDDRSAIMGDQHDVTREVLAELKARAGGAA